MGPTALVYYRVSLIQLLYVAVKGENRMKKISIFASAVVFCAAFSFAQKSPEENFKLMQNAVVTDSAKIKAKMDNCDVSMKKYLTESSVYEMRKNIDKAAKDNGAARVQTTSDKNFAGDYVKEWYGAVPGLKKAVDTEVQKDSRFKLAECRVTIKEKTPADRINSFDLHCSGGVNGESKKDGSYSFTFDKSFQRNLAKDKEYPDWADRVLDIVKAGMFE